MDLTEYGLTPRPSVSSPLAKPLLWRVSVQHSTMRMQLLSNVAVDRIVIIVVLGEMCHQRCHLSQSQEKEHPDMVYGTLSFLLLRSKGVDSKCSR